MSLYTTIVNEIARPLSRRLGTAFSAWMVSTGIADQAANDIVVGLIALGGILADLAASHYDRRKTQ